ncbi:predicted protein [Pyrenophora tritici-repentis Pt-1C-BFP]|uniref:Uncharacterized protein n=1 Tax=Pyrenophora tritici-repentis (strain Pt-1C-BFP) TaxID=426418 RepID=B2WB47_PYRTR|nr:uncharacterized protein PTRG_07510 [Pyrenophora tritici-repentis Pt-1C-BFP]EDU50429.1 predicted protein [Pyrenophora tritici-repentis Pt-1C-BFP]
MRISTIFLLAATATLTAASPLDLACPEYKADFDAIRKDPTKLNQIEEVKSFSQVADSLGKSRMIHKVTTTTSR